MSAANIQEAASAVAPADPTILTDATCILPVKDMARARRFYEYGLGLRPGAAKADGKFVYRIGGTEVALFPREEGTKATHTALSFRVADIAAAVRELRSRGVEFASYDLPGLKTVATSASSAPKRPPGSTIRRATSFASTRTWSEPRASRPD